MIYRFLPLMALVAFVSAPIVIGTAADSPGKGVEKAAEKEAGGKTQEDAGATAASGTSAKKKYSTECLVSEEVIADLDAREAKLKEREDALKEREQELVSQEAAVKEELFRLEGKRAEIQGARQKELAQREEQVNKLMETFEGMSPKAAAQVLGGVEDNLAVLALGRLSSVKAGKILANLKPEKSARLSELMAYGKMSNRKEGTRGDTNERHSAGNEE
jgi:flagellar motility protein MotE (MotC chaperone)